VPHYRIPQKALLLSTLIASVLFEIMKFLFSYYVLNISNYKYIYGAYAAVVITLLWIYVISLIFCIGAAIGQIYVEKNKLKIILNNDKNNGTEKTV
jgi:membrane protein